MSAVVRVALRQVYDSRGQPTVEATVVTRGGAVGRAAAPSGASTGRHEVRAFPEGGVPAALAGFRDGLKEQLLGLDAADQAAWDERLRARDGTRDLSKYGGNTATALSLALAIARANEEGRPLWETWKRPHVDGRSFPAIVGNCMNGGRHAIGGPEFQEFIAFASSPRPEESIRAALAVHARIGAALKKRFPNAALGRGDEGGWVAPLGSLEALTMLAEACSAVRDELHLPVHPGLDLAASEFYSEGRYRYRDQTLDPSGQRRFLAELVDRFGLRYVEDPFDEEEFGTFAEFTREVGGRTLVVGDDLYTTDPERVARGIAAGSSNAVLIKVNQVGTLTETFATVDLARKEGLATVASHRSGEVPEGWLAHLAVASGSAGLKCGLLGGERVAKLNELLRVAAPTEA